MLEMLLNAHTATRSFRELQFDLRAFLEALLELCPLDESVGNGLVEIKWADGSVDVVPSVTLVRTLVGNVAPALELGGDSVMYPSSVDPSNVSTFREKLTLFINSVGFSTHLESFGSSEESLSMVRGVIRQLTASTVELPEDAEISEIGDSRLVISEECRVDDASIVELKADDLYVDESLSFEGGRITSAMRFPYGSKDMSLCTRAPSVYTGNMRGAYYVTGPMRYSAETNAVVQDAFDTGTPRIYVEVPKVMLSRKLSVDYSAEYEYVATAGELAPVDMTAPYEDGSTASLLLLYPKKTVNVMGSRTEIYLRAVAPEKADSDRIVQVCNRTGQLLRACNAWEFSTSLGSGQTSAPTYTSAVFTGSALQSQRTRIGKVLPLNYIELPPYSSVDFLFKFDFIGSALRVYMLPMRRLA